MTPRFYAVITAETAIPPPDPFIEYDESDQWWLKKYGPKGTRIDFLPAVVNIQAKESITFNLISWPLCGSVFRTSMRS